MLERGKGSRRSCRKEGRQEKRGLKLKQARRRQLPREVPRQLLRTLLRQLSRQVLLETGTSMARQRVSAGSAMLMSPALETTGVQVARRYLHLVSFNRE